MSRPAAARAALNAMLDAMRRAALDVVVAAMALMARAERRLRGGQPGAARHTSAPHLRRQLDALLDVNLASAHSLDPELTARAALDAIVQIVHGERALLLWSSEVSGTLTLRAARDAHGADLADAGDYDTGLVERVRAEQRPLLRATAHGPAGRPGSALAVPLLIVERLVGIVYIDSPRARDAFAEEDVAILQAIASHVAVAIETARVAHLEVHVAAERDQRRLAETLASVASALTSTLDLNEVLDRLLESLALVVPYDSAAVLLRENEHFTVVAARGLPEAVSVRRLILPAGNAMLAEVLTARRPVTLTDARRDPRYRGYGGTDYTRSWMGLPLLTGDDVIGLLTIDSRIPSLYGEREATIAFTFAGQAAIAIRNARLFGEVRRLAATDALTELHNRHQFFALAEAEWDAARLLGRPLAAMMLDIDHFKRVNDTYGHAVGDEVLRVVAQRCRAALRDGDILGRYGGEEFALVLPGADADAALLVAERLRTLIAEAPLAVPGGEIPVTISVGVAAAGVTTATLAALLNRADEALYAAKAAGRNRVAVGT